MADHPYTGSRAALPSPREAMAALDGARATMQRSRRASVSAICNTPLIYWGVAWIAGYVGAQFLPSVAATGVWVAVFAVMLARRHWRRLHPPANLIVSGWETRVRRAWWVLFAGSFALSAIASPVPSYVPGLLVGALWGIAAILYAVLLDEMEFGVLGAWIVVLAVALRLFVPDLSLVLFGIGAGGAAIALGIKRARHAW